MRGQIFVTASLPNAGVVCWEIISDLFHTPSAVLTCFIQLWLLEWVQRGAMMMTIEIFSPPVNNH